MLTAVGVEADRGMVVVPDSFGIILVDELLTVFFINSFSSLILLYVLTFGFSTPFLFFLSVEDLVLSFCIVLMKRCLLPDRLKSEKYRPLLKLGMDRAWPIWEMGDEKMSSNATDTSEKYIMDVTLVVNSCVDEWPWR